MTIAFAVGCSVSDLGLSDDDSVDTGTGSTIADQSALAGASIDDPAQTDGTSTDATGDAMSEDGMSEDGDSMSDGGDAMSEDAMSEDAMSDGDAMSEEGSDDDMVDNSMAEEAAAEDVATLDPAAIERQLSTDPNIVYRVGMCYQARNPGAVPNEVPCSEPHTIEIYGVRQLPGQAGAPFVGREAAVGVCNEDFLAVTGTALDLATIFERSVLRPSEETWAAGERDVICYVAYPEPTTEALATINPLRSFGKVSLYGLLRGDCLIDFDDSQTSFTLAACSDPHDAEVFAESRFDAGPYPGDDTVAAVADELCFGQSFEDFVGTPHATSIVRSLRSKPTPETWDLGFRAVTCLLTDGLVRTDSFQGSEL